MIRQQRGRVMRLRARGLALGAVGFGLAVALFGGAGPVRAADPAEQAIRDAVLSYASDAAERLPGLARIDDVPFTDLSPTGTDALAPDDLFVAMRNQLLGLTDPAAGDVERVLEGLDTDRYWLGCRQQSCPDNERVKIVRSGTSVLMTIPVHGEVTRSREMVLPTDVSRFAGAALDVKVRVDGVLSFVLDTTNRVPEQAFAMDTALTRPLVVSFEVTPGPEPQFDANLGFTRARIRLDISEVKGRFSLSYRDPQPDGRLTMAEIAGTSITELIRISRAGNVAAQLSFDSDMLPAEPDLTVPIAHNFARPFAIPPLKPLLAGPGLGDFTRVSALDFITGLGQLATSLRGIQDSGIGDLTLPFTDDTKIRDLLNLSERLMLFFREQGLSDPANPLAVNLDPAAVARLATVQQVASELSIPIRYEAATRELALDLDHTGGEPPATAPTVDFGEQLSRLGLTGLRSTATAQIAPWYRVRLPIRVDLSRDDTPILDRMYVRTGGSEPEVTLDAPTSATVGLRGAIGFMGVSLRAGHVYDTVNVTPEAVDLLARSDPERPMVALDLTASNGKLRLSQLARSLGADNPAATLQPSFNVAVPPFSFVVRATVGSARLASGRVDVAWPNVRDLATLSVRGDAGFNEQLLPFDFNPQDPQQLLGLIVDAVRTFTRSIDGTGGSLTGDLPVLGMSFNDLLARLGCSSDPSACRSALDTLVDRLNALVADPPADVQELAEQLGAGIASSFGLTVDAANPLLRPEIVRAGTTTAIVLRLGFGFCSSRTHANAARAGVRCDRETGRASLPLSVDLGAADPSNRSVSGADSSGMLGVDYYAGAQLNFGVELPAVAGPRAADGTRASASPRLFVLDDSKVVVGASASVEGVIRARLGPAVVALGTEAKKAVGKIGARFSLENNTGSPEGQRVYVDSAAFGPYVSGLPKLRGVDQLCPGLEPAGPYQACAFLPIGDGTLGKVEVKIRDLTNVRPEDFTVSINPSLANGELDWTAVLAGLRIITDTLAQSLDGDTYNLEIPVVGDALDAGAQVVETFRTRVLGPAEQLAESVRAQTQAGAIETRIKQFIEGEVGPGVGMNLASHGLLRAPVTAVALCGAGDCPDDAPVAQITDVQVAVPLGRSTSDGTLGSTGDVVNLGFPGLRLTVPSLPAVRAGWSLDLAFGIDRATGFYVPTGNPIRPGQPEAQVGVQVDLPDTVAEAELAFLRVTGTDQHAGDDVNLGLNLDLRGGSGNRLNLAQLGGSDPRGSASLAAGLTGAVNIDLGLATKVDGSSAAIPLLRSDLRIHWELGSGFGSSPAALAPPSIRLDNLRLDLGSVAHNLVKPVLGEAQRYTKPLQPVIDTITAPIPVISEIQKVISPSTPPLTFLDAMGAVSGAELSLVRNIMSVVSLINRSPCSGADTSRCDDLALGSVEIVESVARGGPIPADRADLLLGEATGPSAGAGGASSRTTANEAGDLPSQDAMNAMNSAYAEQADDSGFSFPAFEDTSQLFQLLVGRDVTLVRWDAGRLDAHWGYTQTFGPFFVGPVPLSIPVSASASVEGRFALGFDTKGIRDVVAGRVEAPADVAPLFNGIFIDDRDSAGGDPPEIRFDATLSAGVSVDLVVVEAGITGGVNGAVHLNLHDDDGKLRIAEIVDYMANPVCLFDVGGHLDAFLDAFLRVGISPFDHTFTLNILRVRLLELVEARPDSCLPPVLAEQVGSELKLNIGPRASLSHVPGAGDPEHADETFVIRPVESSDGTPRLKVVAHGIEQTFPAPGGVPITSITADGGTGSDKIVVEPEGRPRRDAGGNFVGASDIVELTIPVTFIGGAGDDHLGGGAGADSLDGGPGLDRLVGGAGNDTIVGGAGNDEIAGDGGDDPRLDGGDGADTIAGGSGADVVKGGTGNDTLRGEQGDDDIDAGVGDDAVIGGAGTDLLTGGPAVATSASDKDYVQGGPALRNRDDVVVDPDLRDVINGGYGIDTLLGEEGNDAIDGGESGDTIAGGPDDDVITAGGGNDTVNGDEGRDQIFGLNGADLIDGGKGSDTIDGGSSGDLILGGIDDTPAGSTTLEVGDTLIGGAGADQIVADLGAFFRADLRDKGALISSRDGWNGNDKIDGGAGNDVIDARGGLDVVKGGADDDTIRGGAGDDFIRGDDETIKGVRGNDRIYGESGADLLRGDAGDDLLNGGTEITVGWGDDGNDRLFGMESDDVLVGDSDVRRPEGDDVVDGGAGSDLIGGDNASYSSTSNALNLLDVDTTSRLSGHDVVSGGMGADRVYGQDGDDVVRGGEGDDVLEGNAGNDLVVGGTGSDDIVGGTSATLRSGAAVADGADHVLGGASDDVVAGDNAEIRRTAPPAGSPHRTVARPGMTVRYVALAPNSPAARDLVSGGQHNDALFAQAGDDEVVGGADRDFVEGGAGADGLQGDGTVSLGVVAPLTARQQAELDVRAQLYGKTALDGNDDIVGGSASAVGDAGDNMAGGGGHDYMTGDDAIAERRPDGALAIGFITTSQFGADIMNGDAGDDEMHGQQGDDAVIGTDGDDFLTGDDGADVVKGAAGNDVAFGGIGSDLVEGGAGRDDLIGGSRVVQADGQDTLFGGSGDDLVIGDNGTMFPWPQPGAVAVERVGMATRHVQLLDSPDATAQNSDALSGGIGPDVLFGQRGDDILSGGGDDDLVVGGPDADEPHGDFRLVPGNRIPLTQRQLSLIGSSFELNGKGAVDGQDDIVGGSLGSLSDGDDTIYGEGGADVVVADNGTVDRPRDGSGGYRFEQSNPTTVVRAVDLAGGGAGSDVVFGAGGDDALYGGEGDDVLHGEADDDRLVGHAGLDSLLGGDGSDALLGDTGALAVRRNTDAGDEYDIDFGDMVYRVFRVGRLDYRFTSVPTTGDPDTLRGGGGQDALHGGGGDDIMNGDTDGDILFGGHGNDAMWGGRGIAISKTPDDRGSSDQYLDVLFGGHGDDVIDFKPRAGTDPASWLEATNTHDSSTLNDEVNSGTDWIYGGWGADVMVGRTAADRLLDWAFDHNRFGVCQPGVGLHTAHSDDAESFLEFFAWAVGADKTPEHVDQPGNSGYDELGLVHADEVEENSGHSPFLDGYSPVSC